MQPDWNEPRSQARRGGGERAWFQLFAHALNCGEIPPLLHTIDILSYTYDAQYWYYMYVLHCPQIYYSSIQCIKNSIDYSIRGEHVPKEIRKFFIFMPHFQCVGS